MPHVRTRCLHAALLATALMSVVTAPAAAGTATATRELDYDVEVHNGRGTSRALGELTWTPGRVTNDGRLINHGGGRAVVIFHVSVLGAKDVSKIFDVERDGSVPTDFTVLAKRIAAIEVQVCNRARTAGAGRSHRCSKKQFGGG